jgi:hypothetical protein
MMNAKIVLFPEWNFVGRRVCLLREARYLSESHARSSISVVIKIKKIVDLVEQYFFLGHIYIS